MRNLAIVIALAWFWLLFYGVGPLNSAAQIAVGAAALGLVALAAALLGLLGATRRRVPRRPGRP